MEEFLKVVSKLHFDQHGALSTVLPVTIAHREEVLMIRLANIRSQNEVVLVLLVDVMHTESFSCRIGKPSDYVVLYHFLALMGFFLLDNKRILLVVNYAVIVIYSLILERRRLRDARNQALDWASHRVIVH